MKSGSGQAIFIVLGLIALALEILLTPVISAAGPVIDKIVIYKARRLLLLQHNATILIKYKISLGMNPVGDKQQRGDSRTPEGSYNIDYRNPQSLYHLSLHISYPDAKDIKRAKARSVDPGGEIFIHGIPNGAGSNTDYFRHHDWTDGCVAVSNRAIEDIWRRVKNGTKIEIKP